VKTFWFLEHVKVFLFIIFVFLVQLFLGYIWQSRLEGLADDCTLEHRVIALWVDRALFVVQDLVELIMRFSCFLTTRAAIHSADSIAWLSFSCRILLVTGASTIIVALPIVVVV